MVFPKKNIFNFTWLIKIKAPMSIDLKKEREKIVSGSANIFYDEEVKITGERYTSRSFMEK